MYKVETEKTKIFVKSRNKGNKGYCIKQKQEKRRLFCKVETERTFSGKYFIFENTSNYTDLYIFWYIYTHKHIHILTRQMQTFVYLYIIIHIYTQYTSGFKGTFNKGIESLPQTRIFNSQFL